MFIGNRSASMPDQCVDSLRCGTQAPLWLASPHPRAADGIVKSSVCASFRGSCCWVQSNAIHVKACPGNYFVYKFVKPPGCYFAYCADVGDIATTTKPVKTTAKAPVTTTTTQATVKITTTTQPLIRDSTTTKTPDGTNLTETTKSHVTTTTQRDVCGTCQPGETCVSHDGVNWRCGMSDRPVLLRPELVCGRSLLQVGVDQSNLKAAGLDATTAHLADPRCNAHEERGGTVWYLAKRTEGTCGNTLETNGTHAIFSNSLFVYHIHDVSFTRPVSMPFSCYYPLESDASLDMAIKPYLSLKNATMGKGSKVKSTMTLYRDPNFTEVYPAGRVTLPVGSMLHVGVSIEESEMERFLVVLEDCYATQSPNPKDTTRYYIIQNKCASKLREVWVEENGSSLRARFSALLFQYHGDREDVFLHCSLSLCDQRTSSCSPVCAKRKRRTVSPSVPLEPLTIGPISYEVTK
uniref:ZP domain-containing protein n=2 Tax=Esox lucius TaxID=8010 RepID=A0AAY5KY69_ESOLU